MQQSKNVRKYIPVFLGVVIIATVILGTAVWCVNFLKKHDWAVQYAKKLEYTFDDSAVNMIIKKTERDKLYADGFAGFYDFNRDGQAEQVRITFSEDALGRTVQVALDENCAVQIALEPGEVQSVFTVVGIDSGDSTYMAALESVYNGKTGTGKLRWKVYGYQDGTFVQQEDLLYVGMADERGIMKEGVIESSFEGRTFSYDVGQNQNDYIYYRSVVFADMKELGISLPFETVGMFETAYKRNIRGIFNVIIK